MQLNERNPPRKFRKLRIACSVVCFVACVLLVALWGRSYRFIDVVHWTTSTRITLVSELGIIHVSRLKPVVESPMLEWHTVTDFMGAPPRTWSFNSSLDGIHVSFPHRLPVAVLAMISFLAGRPWISLRFRLRALLIATTVVAALLGFAVYVGPR